MEGGSSESKPPVKKIRNMMSLTNHKEQLVVARARMCGKCWVEVGDVGAGSHVEGLKCCAQ